MWNLSNTLIIFKKVWVLVGVFPKEGESWLTRLKFADFLNRMVFPDFLHVLFRRFLSYLPRISLTQAFPNYLTPNAHSELKRTLFRNKKRLLHGPWLLFKKNLLSFLCLQFFLSRWRHVGEPVSPWLPEVAASALLRCVGPGHRGLAS